MERLTADDLGRATRQVGIVDAKGNVANYTGDECNEWAGAVSGKHYTAQGNILAGADVVTAMGKAFEETEGELADKLMAALFRWARGQVVIHVDNSQPHYSSFKKTAVTAVLTTGTLIYGWTMLRNR